MKTTPLSDRWKFWQRPENLGFVRPQVKPVEKLDAVVPGCVHLDLLRHQIIPHPFANRNELGVQWVDEKDWVYECEFEWTANPTLPNRELHFHGLDTVADVFLNDRLVHSHDNFFIPAACSVDEALVEGTNTLRIEFASAIRVGLERRVEYFAEVGDRTDYGWFDERAFVRKPGYMYGWDWGPRLVGAGIYRPIELVEFANKISSFEVSTTHNPDGSWTIRAEADGGSEAVLFDIHFEGDVTLQGSNVSSNKAEWTVTGGLWWPRGHGEQPLHTVTASISGHRLSKKIGLRDAKLLQEIDGFGESFEFEVNGKKIYAVGINWIPNDSFPSEITDQDVRDQLARFAELNCNMVRVWGGGLYESEAFYDACDELGIMVWQDFPYACMYYPDNQAWQDIAEQEAAWQIKRLRHRASLVIWCGNNENLAMFKGKWGGPENCPTYYYGEKIYEGALRRALAANDPGRDYLHSSPVERPKHPEATGQIGDQHYWDVWHGRGDWKYYADSNTRFSSEFGFAASCTPATWQKWIGKSGCAPMPDPVVIHHDKTGKTWEVFSGYVELHYPKIDNLDDWAYFSQLNQRDAFRYGIEYFRRTQFCRGCLIWQGNDCWPVQSWAVQDYERRLKPAGYELKRLYDQVTISIDYLPDSTEIGVHVINDSDADFSGSLEWSLVETINGIEQVCESAAVALKSGERKCLCQISTDKFDKTATACRTTISGRPETTRWVLLGEPKDMRFGSPSLELIQGEQLEVRINGFVADLVLWDQANPDSIRPAAINQPGFFAVTAANESIFYRVEGEIGKLVARSLCGFHEVEIRESSYSGVR